ncbi:MAG: hypothetical protein ACLR4A_19650 [Christensenellales bacterium]
MVLETSGYASNGSFLKMTPFCDCFYFDCKADPALHSACTGVEDTLILQNLTQFSGWMQPWFCAVPSYRAQILPRHTWTKSSRSANNTLSMREFLLPYHKAGASNPSASGKCAQTVFTPPSPQEMAQIRHEFASASPFPYSDAFSRTPLHAAFKSFRRKPRAIPHRKVGAILPEVI